jgi:hypothetical protein
MGHGILAVVGHQTRRALVAEHAVEEGGHADGAADIGTQSEGRGTGTDDRALAAGGTADDALRIVGIVAAAVDLVVALHPHAELGGVGDTERNGAGVAQAGHGDSVTVVDDVAPGHESGSLRRALELEILLDGAGHAEQRRQRLHGIAGARGGDAGIGGGGFAAGFVVAGLHHGIDAAVDTLELGDVGLDHGGGREAAGADVGGQGQGGILEHDTPRHRFFLAGRGRGCHPKSWTIVPEPGPLTYRQWPAFADSQCAMADTAAGIAA